MGHKPKSDDSKGRISSDLASDFLHLYQAHAHLHEVLSLCSTYLCMRSIYIAFIYSPSPNCIGHSLSYYQQYSYYFWDHNGHFCTLKIVRGETRHSKATEKLTRTILHTALKLKERTCTSAANIAELIQQIQSTVSALSEMNGVDESERIEAHAVPGRHSLFVLSLS